MPTRIDRVIVEDFFPIYDGEEPELYQQKIEAHVERLRRCGATHVMINTAVVSIPWVLDPENSYLRFTTYGHALDKFVTSTLNEGIYHEPLLAANRKLLLQQAALAKKYGFRCVIRCVEPTLLPERFFQRHPALRGPRVDHPACSTTPYYALCPTLPEVQDHYRQLLRKMLQLVPEIDEMHIFTNDSGAGFCYSSHLYAGPNGPAHCRETSAAKHAQIFTRTLVEAGREINADFRVVMTSGLGPEEKADFLDGAAPGIASAVYGAYAWGGGLEECWATMAIGPKAHTDPAAWQEVREWQFADYAARVRQVRQHGGIVYAAYNSGYYTGDDPRPYQTHEIMCRMLEWGVTNIIGGGPGWSPYSVNTAVIRHAMAHGPQPTDEVVREIAEEWVGAELAPALCEIWRLSDEVARNRPVPVSGHFLSILPLIQQMPIVPDESQLPPDALDYFMTPVLRDEQTMKGHQGGVWRVLHYTPQDAAGYLAQFETAVFPQYDQAIAGLDALLSLPALTPQQRECLEEYRGCIAGNIIGYRMIYHWILASVHIIAGGNIPAGTPSLQEIISREIELHDADARAKGLLQDDSPRIALMRQHIQDPLRQVDLSAFPYNAHPGIAGWKGAHEA